jgi:hypothetical protein
MPHPSAEMELHADAPRTTPRIGAWGALVWGFVCAGVAWASSMVLAQHLFGITTRAADLRGHLVEATLGMAGIGAACGLVAGLAVRLVRRSDPKRAESPLSGALVITSCYVLAAIAGALTPLCIVAFDESLPPEVSSALAWAVPGFFAGLLGYERTNRSRPVGISRNAAGWGLATAVLTGAVWGTWLALCQLSTGSNLARSVGREFLAEDAITLTACGVGIGFVVSAVAALLLLRDDGTSTSRIWRAAGWGVRLGFATGVGAAMSLLAVVAARGFVPSEVSSSLGFSVAGLLAGLSACPRSQATSDDDRDDNFEDEGQEPGAGVAWVPEEPARPRRALGQRTRAILRLAPIGAVALASLVAAAILAPAGSALTLLAVGLLGLAILPVLWNQERRLAALERRFRGSPEQEP